MSVLRRDDVSVNTNSRLGEKLSESSKLEVLLGIGALLSELRGWLGVDGAGTADDQRGEFGGN